MVFEKMRKTLYRLVSKVTERACRPVRGGAFLLVFVFFCTGFLSPLFAAPPLRLVQSAARGPGAAALAAALARTHAEGRCSSRAKWRPSSGAHRQAPARISPSSWPRAHAACPYST